MSGPVRRTVDALNALSVFGADQEGAYREHSQAVREALGEDVPTVLSGYLRGWAEEGAPGAVVLTGNAGTGKTALAEAFAVACGARLPDSDGLEEIAAGRFVVKDLSGLGEHDRSRVAGLAVEIQEGRREAQLLLCANEGMLRATLEAAGPAGVLRPVDDALRSGLGREERLLVINMNRQRWTAPDTWHALLDYLTRSERWGPCDGCGESQECPLRRNAEALRSSGPREAVRLLVQAASGGGVVTLRELLAALSHAITGGRTCDDVQSALGRGELFDASAGYFHQLFGPSLRPDQIESSPLMQALREIGVGTSADLQVDEWLRDAGSAPSEVRRLSEDEGVHGRVRTQVGPMTVAALGELITISDDAVAVEKCLADLAEGRQFLVLWRRRVFFEAPMLLGGRAATFRRLSRRPSFGGLLDLVEALQSARSTAEARARIVTGMNFLAAGYHSYRGQLVVPDAGSLAARDPGSFRLPTPSLVHSEVPVERIRLRLAEAPELADFLDIDQVGAVLSVARDGKPPLELALTPRLYQAVADSADFRAPVGSDIPEMTELELFYSRLGLERAEAGLHVVDPHIQAIRRVTLPELGNA
ncbi:MAG: ATP-binding protein [Solirubrobacteraceae bacterium]